MTTFGQRRSVTPNVRQNSRRESEGHNIGNRIELNTNLSSRFCESRDTTVEHVKKERKTDRNGGVIEVLSYTSDIRSGGAEQLKTAQRRHHRVEAHTDVAGGECRRYEIESFLHSPARRVRPFL